MKSLQDIENYCLFVISAPTETLSILFFSLILVYDRQDS